MTHVGRRINTRIASPHISPPSCAADSDPGPNGNEKVAFHAFDHFRRQLLAHVLACYAHGIDRELLDAEVEGTLNGLRALRDLHA